MVFCQLGWDKVKDDGLVVLQSKCYYVVKQMLLQVCVDLDESKVDLLVGYDSGLVYMLGLLEVQGLLCYLFSIINYVNLLCVGEDYLVDWL